jgi:dipeptidyl aminopeptidase/acylaminoacyl peptidase
VGRGSVLNQGCGRVDLADCFAAARMLQEDIDFRGVQGRLDTTRGVGIAGHSWGGYLALMCMTHPFGPPVSPADQSGSPALTFTCGVASAGIADWFVQQRETEVRYYDYSLMGGWVYEEEVAKLARERSPLTHAAELRAPLLITHGEKDIDVPFSQIGPFAEANPAPDPQPSVQPCGEAAKRSAHPGAAVELVTYPGEGHGISGSASQKSVLQASPPIGS